MEGVLEAALVVVLALVAAGFTFAAADFAGILAADLSLAAGVVRAGAFSATGSGFAVPLSLPFANITVSGLSVMPCVLRRLLILGLLPSFSLRADER